MIDKVEALIREVAAEAIAPVSRPAAPASARCCRVATARATSTPLCCATSNSSLFWRGLPWDHVPGILLVDEAGGVAWHLDGTPLRTAEQRPSLLVAQSQPHPAPIMICGS